MFSTPSCAVVAVTPALTGSVLQRNMRSATTNAMLFCLCPAQCFADLTSDEPVLRFADSEMVRSESEISESL